MVLIMLFNSIMSLLRGGSVDPVGVLMQILATLVIIFLVLPFHEFAHGWAANKLGDPTARLSGRLTFNPLASIDPLCCSSASVGRGPFRWTAATLKTSAPAWR